MVVDEGEGEGRQLRPRFIRHRGVDEAHAPAFLPDRGAADELFRAAHAALDPMLIFMTLGALLPDKLATYVMPASTVSVLVLSFSITFTGSTFAL